MDAVEHRLFREELDLGFRRVDVDIHGGWRQGQVQHTGGEFAHHDLVAVGLLQRGDQKLGFHRPVIDKEGLQASAGPGVGGLGDVAGQGVILPAAVHLHHLGALPSVNAVYCRLQAPVSRGGQHLLPVPEELEGHLRMGQGLQLHSSCHPAALDGVGFHKFHPGGGVVEQIPNQNGGAVGAAHLGFLQDLSRFQMQAGSSETPRGLGHQIDAADGGDGSQGLAPEAHGANGSQILSTAELGGGVAQERRPGILRRHAAAVVRNPQEGHAPVPNLDGDFGGAGIHRVFQQFFYHAGGPLHHLSGGDQIGDMGG